MLTLKSRQVPSAKYLQLHGRLKRVVWWQSIMRRAKPGSRYFTVTISFTVGLLKIRGNVTMSYSSEEYLLFVLFWYFHVVNNFSVVQVLETASFLEHCLFMCDSYACIVPLGISHILSHFFDWRHLPLFMGRACTAVCIKAAVYGLFDPFLYVVV